MIEPAPELLEAINEGILKTTRNTTDLSKLCNSLVVTFMRYGAHSARVRIEKIDYPFDRLYKSLKDVCRKSVFQGKVKVTKQNGTLYLLRVM